MDLAIALQRLRLAQERHKDAVHRWEEAGKLFKKQRAITMAWLAEDLSHWSDATEEAEQVFAQDAEAMDMWTFEMKRMFAAEKALQATQKQVNKRTQLLLLATGALTRVVADSSSTS